NQTMDMKSPIGKMQIKTTYTYEGSVEKDGKTLALIGMRPMMTIVPDPNAQVEMKVKDQSAKGTIAFDVQAGRLTETNMNQVMNMEVNAGGMTIQQSIRQTIKMKLANPSR